MRESGEYGASLEILDYIAENQPRGTQESTKSSQTILHQPVFFAKEDGIGLELLLILPCQWVLEFGGKVQDIEGTF